MTPPDTNITRQGRRHRWPLLGIFLVLAFVGVMTLVVLFRADDVPTEVPADAVNPVMSDDPAADPAPGVPQGTEPPAAGGAGAGPGAPSETD
jgi:hypothetical protein